MTWKARRVTWQTHHKTMGNFYLTVSKEPRLPGVPQASRPWKFNAHCDHPFLTVSGRSYRTAVEAQTMAEQSVAALIDIGKS